MLKLKQLLRASINGTTFICYQYKDKFLVRKANGVWNEYKSFDDVLNALHFFYEFYQSAIPTFSPVPKDDDDELPF